MYSYLEEYIIRLYRSIGINSPTQLDQFVIAASLGVEISYRQSVFRFGNEVILRNNSSRQQWMDFGHELGHVLLHSGSQLNMYPLYREYQEWRADLFALHFCIPTFMLEKMKLPHTRSETIGLIAHEFNVSHKFAETRLDKWMNQHNGNECYQAYLRRPTREAIVSSNY